MTSPSDMERFEAEQERMEMKTRSIEDRAIILVGSAASCGHDKNWNLFEKIALRELRAVRIAGLREALAIVEGLDLSHLDEAGIYIRARITAMEGK